MAEKVDKLITNANYYLLGVRIGSRKFSVYIDSMRKEISDHLKYFKGRTPEELRQKILSIYVNGNLRRIIEHHAKEHIDNFNYEQHYEMAVSHLLLAIQSDNNTLSQLEIKIKSEEGRLSEVESSGTKELYKKELVAANGRLIEYIEKNYLSLQQTQIVA